MTERVFFYVQHLLGIGHLRRASAVARGLVQAGFEVDFVSGGEPVPHLDLGGARLHQLPPAVSADVHFSAILDESGQPISEMWKMHRSNRLLAIYRDTRPDILLLEMYPFGRRQFRFELLPLLDLAVIEARRPLIACSVRDILVDKGRADRVREMVELVQRYFDLVMVHGDPDVVPFDRTFPAASEIADRIAYTGFVVEAAPTGPAAASGEVLVSAGGGAVGHELMAAAISAKPLSRFAAHKWRLVTGANMPAEQVASLRAQVARDPQIDIETFRADFRALLSACAVSVSQAGYNTVMEVIAAGRPAVVVPFAEGAESEQTLRARLMADRKILELVEANELTPAALAAAIDRARVPVVKDIDLSGAARSAAILKKHLAVLRGAKRRWGMIDWGELDREIDIWAKAGRQAELWWRDDDVIEDTPALRQLLDIARAPVTLCVIPFSMRPDLPIALAGHQNLSIIQHGYDHRNRAAVGAKKSEFPPQRRIEDSLNALQKGWARLTEAFGKRFLPVLTPPWNRIEPELTARLRDVGYRGLSTYSPRTIDAPAPGLIQVNTHVDVIEWRGNRGFIGAGATVGMLIRHYQAKREGRADPREPTGLLTHHLVHDLETWRFLEALQDWCDRRPEVVWRTASAAFFPDG